MLNIDLFLSQNIVIEYIFVGGRDDVLSFVGDRCCSFGKTAILVLRIIACMHEGHSFEVGRCIE